MPKPRKAQVSLEATPYYHCVSRCVRRAFLCGIDAHTGQRYERRRDWIEARLQELAGVFAIDLCAYAVMSNHYHVVLHVDRATAESWDETEVVRRWKMLFTGNVLAERFLQGEGLSKEELAIVRKRVCQWRERLMDISWFMRCMNEPIARQANAEDGCTGRFWEGRFKSQALLDEKALAACLAYVDLNPVRAGLAESPETSDYTAAQRRIRHGLARTPTQSLPCSPCYAQGRASDDIRERYHAQAKEISGLPGGHALLPLCFPLRPPRLPLRD